MNMRRGHRMLRWLAPALAATAVLILAVILFATGILPGIHFSTPHSSQTNRSGGACAAKFSVSPSSGSVGTPFSVQGSAWPAGSSVGVYLVDPSHHMRPVTLQVLKVASSGDWSANVSVPGVVAFHAVGDETTGNGAPQTINQTVAPGSYLIYAAAGDAASFSTSSVCPVKFAILPASGASGASGSSAAIFSHMNTSLGQATSAATNAGRSANWLALAPWMGAALFVLLFLVLCGGLVLLRARREIVFRNSPRIALSVVAVAMAVCMILVTVPPTARANNQVLGSALTTSTLFSDDFEADTIGAFPTGWNVAAGSGWVVQQNGTQALAQTNTSSATLYGVYTGSSTWTDYTLSASVQPGAGSNVNGTSVVSIEGRYKDANNFYSLLIKNGNQWYLGYKKAGNWTTLANGTSAYSTTTWYNWTLTMSGTTISASINGVTLATVTDATFSSGSIGLKTRNQSAYDNILVTAIGANPTPTPTPTTTPVGTPTVGPTPTATATSTPAPTPTATPFGTGTVTGQITDAATGAAIAGASISTVPASGTTTTDNQGNYTLSNLAGNTYDVVATASGYNANHVSNVVVSNNTTATANSALAGIPGYTTMDNFTQPNQSGWNPSTDGSVFLDDASVYPGATLSIQNNTGYADTYTAATDRDEWFGPSTTDQLVSGDFNVSQFGQDSYQHGARLLGRVKDNNNFIDFAINYATNTLQIWVNSNNNWTMMSQVNVAAFQTNQWYHSELLTVGTTSYGKVWAYGSAEPAWQISGSQSSLSSGAGGFRSTYAYINWANVKVQAVTTIIGTVTSASNGTAISGATVSDGSQSVTTDSKGRYTLIEPNTNATYTVTASASGYSNGSSSATTTSLKSTTLNFSL